MEFIGHTPQEHFPIKKELHTDVLEGKYGPVHAVVFRHDDVSTAGKGAERIREVEIDDEKGVTRTYALTFLTYDKNNKGLADVDEEIRGGGLIGKTFREHGYEVKKNVIDVFIMPIPSWMQQDFSVDVSEAKARLTEFYAKKGDETPVVYGTVLEVYSPDFRDPNKGINDIDRAQVNPLTGALQGVGVPADEIWARLDRADETDEWADLEDRLKQAEAMSQPVVRSLREKISKYLDADSVAAKADAKEFLAA
jgi:hypothetical protein